MCLLNLPNIDVDIPYYTTGFLLSSHLKDHHEFDLTLKASWKCCAETDCASRLSVKAARPASLTTAVMSAPVYLEALYGSY